MVQRKPELGLRWASRALDPGITSLGMEEWIWRLLSPGRPGERVIWFVQMRMEVGAWPPHLGSSFAPFSTS